jgi:hypothetical protein
LELQEGEAMITFSKMIDGMGEPPENEPVYRPRIDDENVDFYVDLEREARDEPRPTAEEQRARSEASKEFWQSEAVIETLRTANKVPCASCGAPIGSLCCKDTGEEMVTFAHRIRQESALWPGMLANRPIPANYFEHLKLKWEAQQ